jgi:hypothetical protein
LTIEKGQDLINHFAVESQISQEMRQSRTLQDGTAPRRRRCGRCREIGHRIETCSLGRQDTVE